MLDSLMGKKVLWRIEEADRGLEVVGELLRMELNLLTGTELELICRSILVF